MPEMGIRGRGNGVHTHNDYVGMSPPLPQPATELGESLQNIAANHLHGTDTKRQNPDSDWRPQWRFTARSRSQSQIVRRRCTV